MIARKVRAVTQRWGCFSLQEQSAGTALLARKRHIALGLHQHALTLFSNQQKLFAGRQTLTNHAKMTHTAPAHQANALASHTDQKELCAPMKCCRAKRRAIVMGKQEIARQCSNPLQHNAKPPPQIVFGITFALEQATLATQQMFLNQVVSFALLGSAVALTQHAAGRLEA